VEILECELRYLETSPLYHFLEIVPLCNKDVLIWYFLISSFRRVLYVICFLLGNTPASEVYMPTFWNTFSVPSS